MNNLNKIPGMDLVSETLQGSFCVDAVSDPNPGFIIMEEWKDIKGFEGFYQVSSYGNVKSLDRSIRTKKGTRRYRGILLNPSIGNHGYKVVNIMGIAKCVHRLVAETFIYNPDTLRMSSVNHKDFDRHNNKVVNLEWISQKDNVLHQQKHGRICHGEDHPGTILNDWQVRVIRKTEGLYQKELAEVFGVSRNVIRFIRTGKSWKHLL